jgi:hypothetical protein
MLGVLVLAALCTLAAIGFTAMIGPLVTVAVLLLLVGGGNWLGGRSSPSHGVPREPAGGEDR